MRSSPTTPTVVLAGSVWFDTNGQTLGGAARIALLDAIGRTGSITAAAKVVGLSYKAAWDSIDAMNNLAGEPLVVRATGGRGGGGTTLTPRALRLIATFRAVEREHRRFLTQVGAGIDNFERDWRLIGRLALKTSARNHLAGTVESVTRGAVNDEVVIVLPGGQRIVSVLTHESTETLELAPGVAAFALVKATWVMVMTGTPPDAGFRISARNQLHGTVSTVKHGAINAEVAIELPGGVVVTAIVTEQSVAALQLGIGMPATAAFKASSVIVGVDA